MSENQPLSVARVTRGLDAIPDGSRARRPDDVDDPGIPVAATVVLLRDGASGPEVLLIERPDRGSFAGAWVFPGGKIEEADRAGATTEADAALRAAVRETREETGLDVPAAVLVPLSMWDPPPGLAVRIRTWFYLAQAPAPDAGLVLSPHEAVSSAWIRPADALARHGQGGLTLYPPTWVTLHGLRDATSTDGLLDAARIAGVQRFETVARRTDAGSRLLWHGDAEYDEEAAGEASARHRLDVGALPWTYTRRD